jgi:hypothetical protein
MKDLRELGSKRRETVWSLSAVTVVNEGDCFLVRKDRKQRAYDEDAVVTRKGYGKHRGYALRG